MKAVWDDEQVKFLTADEDFDRNNDVIVRKLFLRFRKEKMEVNKVMEVMSQFGSVEKAEVFPVREGKHWAHVTFMTDEGAYNALYNGAAKSACHEILICMPADSWNQPLAMLSSELIEKDTIADVLNAHRQERQGGPNKDRLLREIIRLSTKTESMLLKDELEGRILRELRAFNLNITQNDRVSITLNELRSILKVIGKHVRELGISFTMDTYPKLLGRYFHKIHQNVGEKLFSLRLTNLPIDQKWLGLLKPVLEKITVLRLTTLNRDRGYDIDFQSYCPKLATLILKMNLAGKHLCKRHPKLVKIAIKNNKHMQNATLYDFIRCNLQLEYFKVIADCPDDFFDFVSHNLPNLKVLCVTNGRELNIEKSHISTLAESKKNLKKLKLTYLTPFYFSGILEELQKFKQLVELKLQLWHKGLDEIVSFKHFYKPNMLLIVALAEALPNLERFYLQSCFIDEKTLNNFSTLARKLQFLEIYRSGLEITDLVLQTIERDRKTAKITTKMILRADKISPDLNKEELKLYSLVKLVPIYRSTRL